MPEVIMSPDKIREGYEVYLEDVKGWHVVGHIETVPSSRGNQIRAWFAMSSHYVVMRYPEYRVRVPELTEQEQAALDEQVARIDQFEAFEEIWYRAQTPEVQAAYDRYVAEMNESTPHADGESDTRHKEGGDE